MKLPSLPRLRIKRRLPDDEVRRIASEWASSPAILQRTLAQAAAMVSAEDSEDFHRIRDLACDLAAQRFGADFRQPGSRWMDTPNAKERQR